MAESAVARQCKVKIKSSQVRGRTGFSTPVYSEAPEMFPLLNTRSYSRTNFASKYGLSIEGPNSKSLTVGDVSKAELEGFLGPTINKNGHRYMCVNDKELIKQIECTSMVVHQKSCVLSNRLITKGMARGFYLEKKKHKKVNWAAYAEWTSSEQRRRRLKLRKQGGANEDDATEMDDLPLEDGGSTQSKFSNGEGGSICDRQGVEVLEGTPPAAEVLEQWKVYLVYAGKEHGKLANLLLLHTKAKDDYVIAECRARSQMEFCFQKLEDARKKLDHLNAEYSIAQNSDGLFPILEDEPGLVELRTEIQSKESLVGIFEGLVADAEVEHRRVSESKSRVCAKVAKVEADLSKCVCNEETIKLLLGQLELEPPLFRSIPPAPYLAWKVPNTQEWVALEKCSFCGFGFGPIWVVKLASCKHAYHELCSRAHFQNFSMCCEVDCKEEMHEKWWSAVGLMKPGTDVVPAVTRSRPPIPKPWIQAAIRELPTILDIQQDEMLKPNGGVLEPVASVPSVTNCELQVASQPDSNIGGDPSLDAGPSSSLPPPPPPSGEEKVWSPPPSTVERVCSCVVLGQQSPTSKPSLQEPRVKVPQKQKESAISQPATSPKKKPQAATRVDPKDVSVQVNNHNDEEDSSKEDHEDEGNSKPDGEADTKSNHKEDDAFQDWPPSGSTKKKFSGVKKKKTGSKEKRGKNVAKRQKVPVFERKSTAKSTQAAAHKSLQRMMAEINAKPRGSCLSLR